MPLTLRWPRSTSRFFSAGRRTSIGLDRYLAALDDRADPRIIKGLRDMDTWRQRNTELVDLALDHPRCPATSSSSKSISPRSATTSVNGSAAFATCRA